MASFPETLLDEPEDRAARVVALGMLEDAVERHRLLVSAPDEEALHDFRVAVRRLRSWLRAEREALRGSMPKRALKALRRVAQESNVSRDAEVFSKWLDEHRESLTARRRVGAAWLKARSDARKREADTRGGARMRTDISRAAELLGERLPHFRLSHHVDHGQLGARFSEGMAVLIRRHAIQLERHLTRVHDPASAEQAHRARIAGKRLRYLLEPIAAWVPRGETVITRLKGLQNTLGDLHDAHVWMGVVRESLAELGDAEGKMAAAMASLETEPAEGEEVPPTADVRPGVMVIAQLVRERARTAFDSFTAAWRPESYEPFFRDVAAIADALERRRPSDLEVERKYLLYSLPENWPEGDVVFIDQGYLPGDRLVERLRHIRTRTSERWVRTVKLGSGVARTEVEEETTREMFDTMWPLTAGHRVTKRRHRIPDGTLVWEIDEFTDRDLVLAEVELSDASVQPTIPEWLAPCLVREVTGEEEYVNAVLAR
jgi:CHAD domain-containing protein/CYTH domain-containing protein